MSQPAAAVDSVSSPLVLAMTGASGAVYAMRLLQFLRGSNRPVHLVVSPAAVQVLRDEMGIAVNLDHFDVAGFVDQIGRAFDKPDLPAAPATPAHATPASDWLHYSHYMDWSAGIASGSFATAGMVVCPCSMSTLAAIAHGLSTNLIQRAADVHLKERRRLVLVPRETPLSLIQLENMAQCARAGAVVLPAMPGWYHRPNSPLELVDFIVSRVCDQLGVPNQLISRWGQAPAAQSIPPT